MDKRIISFLQNYDMFWEEIENLLKISPMLDMLEYDEFIKNCSILINYGYPKSDLDALILANPNIFIKSPMELDKEMAILKQKYEDIEEILKNNPFII